MLRIVTLGAGLSLALATSVALAQAPSAPAAPRSPLPRARGELTLGADAFSLMNACQRLGWGFYARPGEDVKVRRGVRYVLTVANVVPAETDEARRYRLTFLDGKLVGLRTELRAPDPSRVDKARAAHGAPFWEMGATAEWVAPDRSIAYAVWKDGTHDEIVFLGLLRARGFYTTDEIAAELRRRHSAARPAQPSAPKP